MTRRWVFLRCAIAIIAAVGGLLFLRSLGALQWPTVAVYAGMNVVLAGLLGIVRPAWWMGIDKRADAAWVSAAGAAVLAAGLFWPVTSHHATGQTRLDAFLPEYDFEESHELRVYASPDRVMEAVRQVSFRELGVMKTLGRIRSAAMGRFKADPPVSALPILTLIEKSATGFFPLEHTDREFIFGMAGQPWNNAGRPVRLTAEAFPSWMPPEQVKVVANLKVEDAGGGWSRLITETRIKATDDKACRIMARYWRFIYPGSAMIRKGLLEAVRARVANE